MEPTQPLLWRSLDEWQAQQRLQEIVTTRFPQAVDTFQLNRRHFLKLMSASLALAGTSGCSQPLEKVVPYVKGPVGMVQGKPQFYATALTHNGYATGVLVESNMGRPTKIEGNPLHPASLGATDAFTQARILELWDPDRSQTVTQGERIGTWGEIAAVVTDRMQHMASAQGEGLRLLTETITSPTLAGQLQGLLKRYPKARWVQYQPLHRDNVYAGARLAFGQPMETRYAFDKASIVLSLDADFLGTMPGHVRYARDFAARRVTPGMSNRLYAIESACTITGAAADHRWARRPSEMAGLAFALAQQLRAVAGEGSGRAPWLDAIARDLLAHRGSAAVLAGDEQPPEVHALTHLMNQALDATGKTVFHSQPVAASADSQVDALRTLADEMEAGQVRTLLIAGNPAYAAPVDFRFAERLRKVETVVHHGLYRDETAVAAHWHIPGAHELETWGDARAYDGTVTLQQPLIAPLYGGKALSEVLALFSGEPQANAHDLLRTQWQSTVPTGDFDGFWQQALHQGLVPGTTAPTVDVHAGAIDPPESHSQPPGLELVFREDAAAGDGRYANNAWLQELPRPLTKVTWAQVAAVSPQQAQTLGVTNGDIVQIDVAGFHVDAPIWVQPGQRDGVIAVTVGGGRRSAGSVGSGIGFNAFAVRGSTAQWVSQNAQLTRTSRSEVLAVTQQHNTMEGQNLVRVVAAAQASANSAEAPVAQTLYPPAAESEHKWGMSIDLAACIGCNACTIACQAENNIPVVGKTEVSRGREMHWIRVDRYYDGAPAEPRAHFQPVPCMQCEDAPCEVVCPTGASVHDTEGLNDQVYNRCIGTRFCANNCPYKVRRFNFFEHTSKAPGLAAQRNPEVTVRSRGVMEKCTYCVQRIANARIEADKENRKIRDGEVLTACQAVCPTRAIVFGDLNDSRSAVNQAKASPRNYRLLEELNTRPRTSYLAKVVNPNPELPS